MLPKTLLCALAIFTSSCLAKHDVDLLAEPGTSGKTIMLTAGVGISTFLASLYVIDSCFDSEHPYISVPVSMLLGLIVSPIVYCFQPEAKFGRAQRILEKALKDDNLNSFLKNKHSLLVTVNSIYISSPFPRVLAYNNFVKHHEELSHAVTLIKEVKTSANTQELKDIAKKCLQKIEEYLASIERCITLIRTSENWLKELDSYNIMLARKAQESAALAAHQISFNTALSHCYH